MKKQNEMWVQPGIKYLGEGIRYHWWYAVTPSIANDFASKCGGVVCNLSAWGCDIKVKKS